MRDERRLRPRGARKSGAVVCRLGRHVILCSVAGLVGLSAQRSSADEVTVQNDSATDGSQTTPCTCFIPDDSVASWLTSPCDGDIVEVQVLWRSEFSGAPDSTEYSISLFDGSSFPGPGAVLTNAGAVPAVVEVPTLVDGAYNAYRYLTPAETTALSVPVTTGETFAVSLKLINQSSGNPSAPSTVWDHDGCQAGKNGVFTSPGGWLDACTLGVTGDWVIRAVVDCPPPPIPVASEWGAMVATILVLTAGTLVLGRPRPSGA